MSSLKNASIEELERELAVRKRRATEAPVPLRTPNYGPLYDYIVAGISEAIESGREDGDFEHYVYEAALEAIYGKDFFKKWNQLTKNW